MRARVLIVGGGPAGMTAAIALGRRGIESLIVEIEPAPRPVGIGLALQNSPLRALHSLGLDDACAERGFIHEAVNICAPDGAVVHRVLTPSLVPHKPSFVALARRELAEIMAQALDRVPQAEIRYGTSVQSLSQADERVQVTLTDGTSEEFELVVGADGLHSKIRELAMPGAPEPRRVPQVIWRASAPRPPEIDAYFIYDLRAQGRVGLVPISDGELYLWMLQPGAGRDRPAPDQLLAALQEQLAPFQGRVSLVAERLRPDIDFRHLSALLVPDPWYRGRVLLIGDAAHTTTPQIAYGVGIAIEDSVVLAELLEEAPSVDEALERFMVRRYPRSKLVVETSLQLSAWEVDPPDDPALYPQLTGRALGALSEPF